MAGFPYEYGMQDNLSEIYCSITHRESLVHSEQRLYSTVVWALTWLVKMAFWVPGACQEVKNLKLFKIPYSNVRPIRCGMSPENPLLKFNKI